VFVLASPPHYEEGGADFLVGQPISLRGDGIREPFEHNKCGGSRGVRRGEQRRRRERARERDENRLATGEFVEHHGDAVGPLLQGRHRSRSEGIRCAGSWLVEEDQPAQ
jgi:hypothetical protein